MTSLFYNTIGLLLQAGFGTPGPPPPRPANTTNGGALELPIDENIWVLLAMGIILGAYILYKNSRTTNKAS